MPQKKHLERRRWDGEMEWEMRWEMRCGKRITTTPTHHIPNSSSVMHCRCNSPKFSFLS